MVDAGHSVRGFQEDGARKGSDGANRAPLLMKRVTLQPKDHRHPEMARANTSRTGDQRHRSTGDETGGAIVEKHEGRRGQSRPVR